MNRLSTPHCARRLGPQGALLLLLAALPGAAPAQTPAAAPPATTRAAPAPQTPPIPAKKEAAIGEVVTQAMLAGDKRLDRVISLDVISVPLD